MIKYLLLVLVLISAQGFAQEYTISNCEAYTYSLGSDTIGTGWNLPDYEDSRWEQGWKHIGFGDDDDTTVVVPTVSLYIRVAFDIADVDSVKEAVLEVDYDDGVVAYLNGIEILRKNLPENSATVAYDQLALTSHEASSAHYRDVNYGYFIDSLTLQSALRKGTNILAFQVHNDSINGSDLSFNAEFINRTYSQFYPYSNEWRAIRRIPLDSTKLPIVILNSSVEIGNVRQRQPASLQIIHNSGHYNKLSDLPNEYNGNASFEVRGKSSADWAKKSFNVELKDELGATKDAKILGMSKDNDWVLAANYTDRSCLRNRLVYDLATGTNTTAPDSRFVEVIFNGDYLGLYQLLEKPKRGKNRIDVQKQDDFQTENITGGYIFKFDKWDSSPKELFVKKVGDAYLFSTYPDARYMSTQQTDYIFSFWDSLSASYSAANLFDPELGYKRFVDTDSYIDFTIINEICRNSDGFRFSTFMHKPAGEPLHYGPLWDFDLCFGNSSAQGGNKTSGWLHSQGANGVLAQKKMFQDSVLLNAFKKRYKALRTAQLSEANILMLIDSIGNHIDEARQRNYQVWSYNGYEMNSWVGTPSRSVDTESDTEIMKTWINSRLKWMDDNIDNLQYAYTPPVLANSVLSAAQNSPAFVCFDGCVVLQADVKPLSMDLYSITGEHIASVQSSDRIETRRFPAGMYIVVSELASGEVLTQRVVLNQ